MESPSRLTSLTIQLATWEIETTPRKKKCSTVHVVLYVCYAYTRLPITLITADDLARSASATDLAI